MQRDQKLICLIFGLVLTLIIAGVGVAESSKPVRIAGLSGITGLTMVKMMETPVVGNTPAEYNIFKSPDLLVGKIITGEVDIAALPINTATILYNKGVPVKIASVIGWGVMYVVGETKIQNWVDLKGKEIYAPAKGAVPDLLFRYLLAQNGLNPDRDLKIQYISSPVELAQLAASGKLSLAVLPEPWVTEVTERNSGMKILLDFQKEWQRIEKQNQTYPQTCIIINKQFAAANPELVQLFLKELDQAIAWINSNPEAAGVLAEKHVQISATAIRKGLSRCNLKYVSAGKVRSEIERFLQRLAELDPNAIGGKLPDEQFYYQP